MESKFTKIIDKNEWQGLLGKVLFKTFFHNMEWEEFLEKQFKWLKFERYLYNKGTLILSLARAGDKLVSHPFCEYGGPLPLIEKIDYEQFRQDLFSEFPAFVPFSGTSAGKKNQIKISFHPRLLNYFNETGPDPVSSGRVSYFTGGPVNLRKTTRHEIEKAQTNNLQIEKCQNQKDLRDFYGLSVKSAKKHKIPAYPISFFNYFLNSKEAEIILAKKNNFVIAGSVFLLYDKFVHYFRNAIDERHRNLGANYLILWRQIQKCLRDNRIFDFGGTRLGSPLQIFKRGWGGREYPILELKNYSEKSQLRQSKLRNILGLMPVFLIKKISPRLLKYKL